MNIHMIITTHSGEMIWIGPSISELAKKLEGDLQSFSDHFDNDFAVDADRQKGHLLVGKLRMFKEMVPDDVFHINLPADWTEIEEDLLGDGS